ncbi:MAG: hypothetical protein JJ910_08015 [Maricaulis sp.]|nr:hypothetical protein [Maricaulis sp.]
MSSSNPTGSGGRFPLARTLLAVAIFAGLIAVVSGFVSRNSDTPTDRTYPQLSQDMNLQTELELLPENTSWREHANLPENTRSEAPEWLAFLPWGAPEWLAFLPWGAIGQLVFWGIIGLLIIGMISIVIILVRNVGTGRFARDEIRQPRKTASEPLPTIHRRETQPLTLSQILEMTDLEEAIGELQRSALAAAAFITGVTFKRSVTAREALRKLQSDWQYRPVVAGVIREAEQVRFAGRTMDRPQLEMLVESIRPMLKQAGGAG